MPGFRRNRLGACLALAAAHFCLGVGFGQPILVHLRNGDRLSGQFVAEEPGQITITNAILGRIVLPLAQIERREWITNQLAAARSLAAQTNAAPTTPSPVLSPSSQRRLNELQAVYLAGQLSADEYHRQRAKLLAESAAPSPATNQAVAQGLKAPAPATAQSSATPKAPVVPVKPAGPKPWSGEVLLGTDLAYGQKDRELYSGRLKINYAKVPLRNSLDYLFTYGRTDGELSANRMDGTMKTDYDLTPRVYLYSLEGAGYDEIRKIDWRYEVGPGSGYQLVKRTNFVFRVEGGFQYQVQNFEGNRQDEIFYHRVAEEMKWNIGKLFTFDEKAEYMPEFTDFSEYRLRVEANVRYWLRSNLSLNFTVINLYDTMSAPGVGQNDLQLRSSIGLKF
jgi:putative salt-induced outer membrane protein